MLRAAPVPANRPFPALRRSVTWERGRPSPTLGGRRAGVKTAAPSPRAADVVVPSASAQRSRRISSGEVTGALQAPPSQT
jgi:hypothetical protein